MHRVLLQIPIMTLGSLAAGGCSEVSLVKPFLMAKEAWPHNSRQVPIGLHALGLSQESLSLSVHYSRGHAVVDEQRACTTPVFRWATEPGSAVRNSGRLDDKTAEFSI